MSKIKSGWVISDEVTYWAVCGRLKRTKRKKTRIPKAPPQPMLFQILRVLATKCSVGLVGCSPLKQQDLAEESVVVATLSRGTLGRSSLNSSSFSAMPKAINWKYFGWEKCRGKRSHLAQLKPLIVVWIHFEPFCKQGKGFDVATDCRQLDRSWAPIQVPVWVKSVGVTSVTKWTIKEGLPWSPKY